MVTNLTPGQAGRLTVGRNMTLTLLSGVGYATAAAYMCMEQG
jgi:hypothetical protein